MKNTMLMISKVKVEGTLLTSIVIISALGILLFLILNRNQKLKYLKKFMSIILILAMLLLPFSSLLNVKAEAVTITTDDTKALESDNNFKLATNKTTIQIWNSESEYDKFIAYKILDIYYNKVSNEITYDFTTDFKTFIATLPEGDDFKNLDISGYQKLTSDSDDANHFETRTASTLNKLVSKYATYIKKTKNITGIDSFVVNESNKYESNAEVEAGSYLIFPSKVFENITMGDGILTLQLNTYGVTIGNAVFTVENNAWNLPSVTVSPKTTYSSNVNMFLNVNANEIVDFFSNEDNSRNIQYDVTYSASKELYFVASWDGNYETPTNTNSSILANETIMKKLGQREYIFPKGVSFAGIYQYIATEDETVVEEANIKTGSIYINVENQNVRFADVINNIEENKLIFTNIDLNHEPMFFIKLKVDNNINVGSTTVEENLVNYGNKITTNISYLKDAYVDITGMDQTTAEAAVLGTGVWNNTIYTHGITVTNKVGSEVLNGAKFQVYSDKDCTTKVGDEFEITENGTYTFKGLNDTNTYYLKQTKAPTGYRLLSEVVELNPTNLNKEVGLYNIEVTNTKMGLLPSTGGLGTIFYTLVGLVVIGIGAYEVIKYSKKQVNN